MAGKSLYVIPYFKGKFIIKLLLPLLGPSSYFHLAQFLQHNPDVPQEILTSGTFSHQKPQLLVSVDHAFFDFVRPFDPPLPTDPDTNLVQQTGNLFISEQLIKEYTANFSL